MIYVYRPAQSSGARLLAEALDGRRIKAEHRLVRRIQAHDCVVSWGASTALPGVTVPVRTLNNGPLHSKMTDVRMLRDAGIATITVRAPFQPREEPGVWLPRISRHVGGTDLLIPPAQPAFWVRKEYLVREFRVHSFLGRSLRAGIKAPRDGWTLDQPDGAWHAGGPAVHPWVRSWNGGWRISYADGVVKQRHRDLAHAAVAALQLDFGAVDLGQYEDGTLMVLEVNRAPGIEAGTIEAYAKAIRRWEAQ
jgi:hypothetical protein